MRLINIFYGLVALLFLSTPLGAREAVVEAVIDGDTILIKNHSVRLIGIDTPEVAHPKYGKRKAQCFGPEAKQYLSDWIKGRKVKLVSDPLSDAQDKYGRELAYVYYQGILVNAQLIKQGYARAYLYFPFRKKSEFARDQKIEQKRGRGLWGACQP